MNSAAPNASCELTAQPNTAQGGLVMYALTITESTRLLTSRHHNFERARRALLVHARRSDVYLHPLQFQIDSGLATFELVSFDATGRCPQVTGTAQIEPSPRLDESDPHPAT